MFAQRTSLIACFESRFLKQRVKVKWTLRKFHTFATPMNNWLQFIQKPNHKIWVFKSSAPQLFLITIDNSVLNLGENFRLSNNRSYQKKLWRNLSSTTLYLLILYLFRSILTTKLWCIGWKMGRIAHEFIYQAIKLWSLNCCLPNYETRHWREAETRRIIGKWVLM